MVVPRQTKSGAFLARQAAKYAADSAYQLSRMKKLPGLANGITSALKRNAYLQGEVAKPVSEFVKRIPGKGNAASKAAAAGSTLGGLVAIGGVAIIVGIQAILQNIVNSATFKNFDYLNSEIQKSFDRYQKNVIDIRAAQAQIREFKQNDQRTRDRIYAIEKQQPKIRDNANDALYEVRQGRKIIDNQLAKYGSDIAALKSQFDRLLNNANNNFQKTVETTIANLQKALQQTSNEVTKANSEINKLTTTSNAKDKIISQVESDLRKANTTIAEIPRKIEAQVKDAFSNVEKIAKQVIKPVETKVDTTQAALKTYGLQITPSTGMSTPWVSRNQLQDSLNSQYRQTLEELDDFWKRTGEQRITTIMDTFKKTTDLQSKAAQGDRKALEQLWQDSLKEQNAYFNKGLKVLETTVDNKLDEVKRAPAPIIETPPEIKRDLDTLKASTNQLKIDIGKIDTKIKERETVDKEANRKLDQIIPMLGGIPLIPGRVIDGIRPNLLTPPQIEAATGNAICKSLNGGCGKASVDDAVGRINSHNNNNTGSVLGAINAGLNTADLALLGVINSKLGDQLPGGISGKLTRFTRWLQLDRALNMLTFAATIHNAAMLSNDIGQTLLGALNNVLTLIGLKDDSGNAFDIGSVISATFENIVKGIIGAENYTTFTIAWAKANRIYQASTNVLNSFLNLSQTILQASELIAAYTGRIGNALKKGGVILENAYGWMNPQPKFNRVTKFLEGLQNGASTIQMVTQAPLDVVNAVTETTTAATEFVKAVKEDDKPENQPTATPEPDKLKEDETAAKTASAGLEITDLDLEADE